MVLNSLLELSAVNAVQSLRSGCDFNSVATPNTLTGSATNLQANREQGGDRIRSVRTSHLGCKVVAGRAYGE